MKLLFISLSAVKAGSRVAAFFNKDEWYLGTVDKISGKNAVITYDDGTTEKVPLDEEGSQYHHVNARKKKGPLSDADVTALIGKKKPEKEDKAPAKAPAKTSKKWDAEKAKADKEQAAAKEAKAPSKAPTKKIPADKKPAAGWPSKETSPNHKLVEEKGVKIGGTVKIHVGGAAYVNRKVASIDYDKGVVNVEGMGGKIKAVPLEKVAGIDAPAPRLPAKPNKAQRMSDDQIDMAVRKHSRDKADAAAKEEKPAKKEPSLLKRMQESKEKTEAKKATPAAAKKTPAKTPAADSGVPAKKADGTQFPRDVYNPTGMNALVRFHNGPKFVHVVKATPKSITYDTGSGKQRTIDRRFVNGFALADSAELKKSAENNMAKHKRFQDLRIEPGRKALVKFAGGVQQWVHIHRTDPAKGTFSIPGSGNKMRDLPASAIIKTDDATFEEKDEAGRRRDQMAANREKRTAYRRKIRDLVGR